MERIKNNINLIITVVIIGLFVWFLVIFPMIMFGKNEKRLENAAKRYFELNANELPTGERVKTVSLKTLYHKAFIEKDLFVPYTKKTCSVDNSWVKVKKVNGDYVYYTYLECGFLSSTIDHKGPEIKLNGDVKMVIGLGEEFKDPGVNSVVDNNDGKKDIKSVEVKGTVNTEKIGSYEIEYIAFDNLSNKTVVKREVNVVQRLNDTVKKAVGEAGSYKGANPNNYVYFSNMVFRILDLKGDKVRIVADKDIANVNYDGIEEWFKYYESNLTDEAKKLIVSSKYCNQKLTDDTLNTTKCNSYSKNKKFGLLSIDDINRANTEDGNYLIMDTMTWSANAKDNKNAYYFRRFNFGVDSPYLDYKKTYNLGVKPVITIKGDLLVKGGNGTEDNPYILEDYIKPKKNVKVNTRPIGEYLKISDMLYRIQKIEFDGTVRIIGESTLYNDGEQVLVEPTDDLYNPKEKGNVGYIINNKSSEYMDTSYFINHDIDVPIYKGLPQYKGESKTKKYKVKISAPNMYEMFSATSQDPFCMSYWVINTSHSEKENLGMSDIGAIMSGEESIYYTYGIRPVGYIGKDTVINSGNGTKNNPFSIEK